MHRDFISPNCRLHCYRRHSWLKFAAIILLVSACSHATVSRKDNKVAKTKPGDKSSKNQSFKPYKEECSSCHLAYPAGFLPERSWKKLMAGLDDHFEENASLDDRLNEQILDYLRGNASDSALANRRARKFGNSIDKDDSPIRVTETPYWKHKHSAIKSYVWKRAGVQSKSKCESCHKDADKGVFDERSVKIPKS